MPLRRFGRPGLIGTVARTAVVAGTASMTVNALGRHQQQRAAEQQAYAEQQAEAQQPAYAAPPPPPPPPADAPPSTDMVSRLNELAQLHSNGALSDEEFAAAKAKLLS